MDPEISLPYSQVPATSPYPEPNPSSPHKPLPLPEDPCTTMICGEYMSSSEIKRHVSCPDFSLSDWTKFGASRQIFTKFLNMKFHWNPARRNRADTCRRKDGQEEALKSEANQPLTTLEMSGVTPPVSHRFFISYTGRRFRSLYNAYRSYINNH